MAADHIESTLGVTFSDPREDALLDWERARRLARKWCPDCIEQGVALVRSFVLGGDVADVPGQMPLEPEWVGRLRESVEQLQPITARPNVGAMERVVAAMRGASC